MNAPEYKFSVSAPVSAADAYDRIARVSEWWTRYVDGSTRNAGDAFTVRFGEGFEGTSVDFRVAEAVPGSKSVWQVTNCFLPWLENKTEWTDTRLIFEVSAGVDGTSIVTLTHQGLVPEIECYNDCVKGWNQHFGQDFQKFLADGHAVC